MYPNNFNIREDYCNSQYSDLSNQCNMKSPLINIEGRSKFDQKMVPLYNTLALNTLTYPALNPNKTPRLSPFNELPPVRRLGVRSPKREIVSQRENYGEFNKYSNHDLSNGNKYVTCENYTNSKLAELDVDLYFSKSCGWCKKTLDMLEKAGEKKNVNLKNVAEAKNKQEVNDKNLGRGIPVYYSNKRKTKHVGHAPSVEVLIKNLTQRENYTNSKLAELDVDLYFSKSCGWCKKTLDMLEKAGEKKNVNLKNVAEAKNKQEVNDKNLGGGVPVYYSNKRKTKHVGHAPSVEVLIKNLTK